MHLFLADGGGGFLVHLWHVLVPIFLDQVIVVDRTYMWFSGINCWPFVSEKD